VYLIKEENGWTEMLLDSSRYLVWTPSSNIMARQICHSKNQLRGSEIFYQWLLGQPYHSPNLGCWRLTDQPEEMIKGMK
jgi:hypothetical protein